jgi:hypothetical protein
MSWVPAQQVLATVAAQRQVLAEQQARIATATQSHAAERQKVDADRVQAVSDLGAAILPALDRASIAAAAEQVGLAGLPGEDVPGRLEARRAWLVARMKEIAHDPRYAQAELLRHPRTGSLTTAIAEAEEMRAPANEVITRCTDHPRFERLVSTGFGTPEHKAAWWRYSHWEDRSAADAIVAFFPGKTSFAEVISEYTHAVETVASFDAELARLRAEVGAGVALEQEYRSLYAEYQTIDAKGLEYTRGRIVQHMLTADASLLSQRLVPWPALRLLFLRASGLAAKVTYLDGIQQANVSEIQKDVATAAQRLDAVEAKTRKRWAPMPIDKYQKLAEDRRPRYEKRWQRYNKVYTTVYTYDRWDRGSRYDDLLWWDLMTRGRYDGSYLADVDQFHRLHPDYQFDPTYLSGKQSELVADIPGDPGGGFEAIAAADMIAADSTPMEAAEIRSTDAS